MNSHAQLLAALGEERTAARAFVALLQQEQTLLLENSIDSLLMLAEKKSAQALHLNNLTEMRRTLMSRHLPLLDFSVVKNWLSLNSQEGLSLWMEVRALSEQAQQLNQINGELIQMKLRHNQQTLTALSQAVSQANVYGPDGQTNFSAGTGRSLGNV